MKRLLIPLLAALALPTEINAEAFYLDCALSKSEVKERDLENGKVIKNFKTNKTQNLLFALNEFVPSASVSIDGSKFFAYEVDEIKFRFNQIKLIRQKDLISIGIYGNSGYTINRENGSIYFLDQEINQSTRIRTDIKNYGTCKKTKRQKTLF
tara:strand:- start:117 stop:575 length:459 start_codon:yes stop_codon:yes gene_type:complete